MKDVTIRPVVRFLASGLGLSLVLGIAVGGTVMHLGSLSTESDRLHAEIAVKQESYSANIENAIGSANVKFARSELGLWKDLAKNEALRIAALSAVAQEANVTIVSLGSLDSKSNEEAGLTYVSHDIESVGEQHQIAQFLDGIYAMEGMASIDSLVLESYTEGNPEMLLASLKVTWCSLMVNPEVSP